MQALLVFLYSENLWPFPTDDKRGNSIAENLMNQQYDKVSDGRMIILHSKVDRLRSGPRNMYRAIFASQIMPFILLSTDKGL